MNNSGAEAIKALEIFVHFSVERGAWVLHPLIVVGQSLPPGLIVEEPTTKPPEDVHGEIIMFNEHTLEPIELAAHKNSGCLQDAFVAVNDVNGRLNQMQNSLGQVEEQVEQLNIQSQDINNASKSVHQCGGQIAAMQQKLDIMQVQVGVCRARATREEARAEKATCQLQATTRRHQRELIERGIYVGVVGQKFEESVEMFAKLKAEERIADEIRERIFAAEKETIERRNQLMKHIQDAKQKHMEFVEAQESLAERQRDVELEAALVMKEKSAFAEERSHAEASTELNISRAAKLATVNEYQAESQSPSRLGDEERAAEHRLCDEEPQAEEGTSAVLRQSLKSKGQLHTICDDISSAPGRTEQDLAQAKGNPSRIRTEALEASSMQAVAQRKRSEKAAQVRRRIGSAALRSRHERTIAALKAETEQMHMRSVMAATEESKCVSECEAKVLSLDHKHQGEMETYQAEIREEQSKIRACEELTHELEEQLKHRQQEASQHADMKKKAERKATAACAEAADFERMTRSLVANPLKLVLRAFKNEHVVTEFDPKIMQVAVDSREFAIKASRANRNISQQCAVFNQSAEKLRGLLQGKAKNHAAADEGQASDSEWKTVAREFASCVLAVIGLLSVGGLPLVEDCLERLAWLLDKGTKYARSAKKQYLADAFATVAVCCLIHSNARERLVAKVEDPGSKIALSAAKKHLESGEMQTNLADILKCLEELAVSKETRVYKEVAKSKTHYLISELSSLCETIQTVVQSMATASRVCQAWRIHDTYLSGMRRVILGSTCAGDNVSLRPPFLPVLGGQNPSELESLLKELAAICYNARPPHPVNIRLPVPSSPAQGPQRPKPQKRRRHSVAD